MFHRKTLEEKLRAAGATTGAATVLTAKQGYPTYSGSSGTKETTKYTYRLRVEPASGAPFEAETFIRGFQISPAPVVGDRVPVLYDPARPADVAIDTQDLRDTKWAGIYLEGLATPEPTPGPGGWVQTGNVIASASARKRIQGKKLEHCAKLRDRGKLTQAQFAELEARLRSDQPGIT